MVPQQMCSSKQEVRLRSPWKRRVGTVLGAAAAGVVATAGGAYASDGRVDVADLSGYATWVENGDTLKVCDQRGDGWGVRGYVYRPYAGDPANGSVLIKKNDPSYDGECASVSQNIDESVAISLKVCNYQGSVVLLCQYTRLR